MEQPEDSGKDAEAGAAEEGRAEGESGVAGAAGLWAAGAEQQDEAPPTTPYEGHSPPYAGATPPHGGPTPPYSGPTPPYGGATPPYGPPHGTPPFGNPWNAPYGEPAPGGGWQYHGSGWGAQQPPPPPWAAPDAQPPEPGGRRRSSRWKVASLVAVGVLAVAALGGFIGHEVDPGQTTRYVGEPAGNGGSSGGFLPGGSSGTAPNSSAGTGPSDSSAIASRVSPGLVDVNTTIDYGEAVGAATGMVLTSNGEILTNNHVVDGATSIRVTDIGNGHTYAASVVGYDISKDVAVIQLSGASGLQTVQLGDSSTLAIGAQVVAIGNAGGAGGTPSYAGGTLTALHQSITASDQLSGTSERLSDMIETDAAIVSGDSGGPLVDTSGQVIGMDTAGSNSFQFSGQSGSQGYAVPINVAISAARAIEAGRKASTVHIGPTAFLGVQVQPNASASGGSGAVIAGVVPGGPAANAGLGAGDIITSIGGHQVTTNNDLRSVLVGYESPGQRASVTYYDPSGTSHTVTVTLVSGPAA